MELFLDVCGDGPAFEQRAGFPAGALTGTPARDPSGNGADECSSKESTGVESGSKSAEDSFSAADRGKLTIYQMSHDSSESYYGRCQPCLLNQCGALHMLQ